MLRRQGKGDQPESLIAQKKIDVVTNNVISNFADIIILIFILTMRFD